MARGIGSNPPRAMALSRGLQILPVATVVGILIGGASLGSRASQQTTPAQRIARKIVVLAGEDAVNIIQQKTAVAPLVEVRDDNDLPVAGVLVTFSVGGAKTATFSGGVQTLSVVTNAAGRAAATGFTPVASGTVQINVTAAVQGQTLATTITQTNFMTAAQAAQAGASASGTGGSGGTTAASAGGGAAGGGGLSGLAIAGIAGGAAAGAVVTAKALSEGDDDSSNSAPVVSGIVATPASALLGTDTPIAFSAQVSDPNNDPLTYAWDFGDGQTSSAQAPTHVYRSEGTFTARVTITDGALSASAERTVPIRTITGTWLAGPGGFPDFPPEFGFGAARLRFNLVQNGSSIGGTSDPVQGTTGTFGPGTITGAISSTSPRIVFDMRIPSATYNLPSGTIRQNPGTYNFRLDPGSDANTLSGPWILVENPNNRSPTIVLTRQ